MNAGYINKNITISRFEMTVRSSFSCTFLCNKRNMLRLLGQGEREREREITSTYIQSQ